MTQNRYVICAGCEQRHATDCTTFYRRKRWCGSNLCKNTIDQKVKHANYLKQQRKIKNGTFRHGVNAELREYIKNRDEHRCRKCKTQGINVNLQVHHIVPVSDGGDDGKANLILLCSACHTKVHKQGYDKYIDQFNNYSHYVEGLVK
jgi:5-methylcytosine-specific restriction endonuclease McrA